MKNNFSEKNIIQQLKDKIDALTETVSLLKRSEQLLANAINDALIGMVTLTVNGKFRTVNAAFCQITGYTEKELLTMNISQITHPNDIDIGNKAIEELTSGKAQKANFEKRYIHKNGNTIYAQVSTVIIQHEIGTPQIFFTQVIDITDRKEYQGRLIESENKYKALAEYARDGIIVIQNDVIKFANQHTIEIYGASLSNVIGQPFLKFVHSDSVEMIKKRYANWRSGKKVPNFFKVDLINSNKEKRICEINSSTIVFDGQPSELVIIHDITECKRAEESQKEIDQKYQLMATNTLDTVWTTDLKFNLTYVNNAIFNLLGYTPDEFIDLTPTVFTTPEGIRAIQNAAEQLLAKYKNGEIDQAKFELQQIRKDGTIIDVEITSNPLLDSKKNIIGFQGRSIDITKRKFAEKEIVQKTKELEKQFKSSEKQRIATLSTLSDLNETAKELQSEINVRKKSVEKLAAANKNLEMLAQTVSSMNECVSISDTEHKIIFVNEAFTKTYGYKKKEIIGKTSQLIRAEEQHILINEIRKKTKLGGWKGELLNKKKDGTIFPIELSITPLRDINGKIIAQIGISTVIIERKQTEEALLASEERYRKFFMEDLTGDYLTTREGKIIDCNPQYLNIFGFKSLNQAQKYNASKLYVSKSKRKDFLKRLEKNKVLYDEKSELYKINGEKIIIQENVSGEFDDDGKLLNIRGFIYDITKSMKAEQEIVKLSSAVEQSPVSIVITDTDGAIEYVNPMFEKLTGYSLDEAIGSKPSILKSGVTPDSEYSKLWKTITAGKVWIGEFLNKKKNGELYWESATISPIFNNNNKITHFLAVKEDVTKKKAIVAELIEREEKYRTLTQNLNVGVYRSTPGKNGIFIEANPAFLKIFGFRSKNELERYKTVDFYLNPLERDRIEKKLASKGFLINEEVKLRKKDGSLFFASISSTLATDELGKVIHHDGIIEDITERKEMMERILQERDRSQLYLDIAGVMFIALDRTGNVILSNQKACEIIGTTEEEMIGKNWFDNYLPKEIQLNTKDIFNNLMNRNAELAEFHENEILTTSGEKRIIAWQNSALKDESGKIFGIVSSGLDITESKEDEELRNKLYETSRHLTESLDIDVVLKRLSKQARTLLKCNGVTVYMCEDDKKTLKPVVAYDPPYTKQVLASKIDIDNSFTGQAIKAKKGKIFNYHDNIKGAFHVKGTPKTDTDNIIVSPLEIDGEVIGALTLVRSEVPFTDKDLSVVNAFAVYGSTAIKNANSHKQILHEIEERKQAQKLLKESHDRYESIFNGAVDGIIYLDLKGKILSVNSAFTKAIGIKKTDLIGKNGIQLAKRLLPKKSMIENMKFIKKTILKGEAVRGYPIEYNNRSLEFYAPMEEGKFGITVMVRDVTERNKARRNIELHQNNLATLSNELTMAEEKAKRQLAITLHDKLGQSLVLANFRSNELNKKVEKSEHKKIISEISGFLEDAINESRNITYELSPPVLYEMGLVPAINWKLDEIEKNNNIKTTLINRSKSYEIGKREQIILYRSINELLQNVLKHSKAKNVNVSFRLLTKDYRITVSDNGIGFDLEAMSEKALSQKKFGLFSIMERIKYIGGSVEIDTKHRKGTKIIINMPIKN